MQVKVFEAQDMATALKMVKETLGPDALVLSTRTVRKGAMGLLGKPMMEVTAAVDAPTVAPAGFIPTPNPTPTPAPTPTVTAPAPSPAALFYGQQAAPTPAPAAEEEISYGDIWRKRKVIDPLEDEFEALKGKVSAIDVDSLRGEINELKDMVRGAVQAKAEPAPVARPAARPGVGQGSIARMMEALTSRGVHSGAADIIVRRALEKTPPPSGSMTVEVFLSSVIADLIKVRSPISARREGPRKVALVGPTGVGKTTTIAKLAAEYLLNHGRKVALVTIDIYRIAAAEQLKVYGEIMNVPVDVVLSPEQLKEVLARHQDKELILIDTAGRSPKDEKGLEELEKFIGPGSGTENHLVLSATTREKEMAGALGRFSRLPIESLIFTKLDECESLGFLLNMHLKQNIPLSYLTNGQRVPEDLVLAEPAGIAGLIMGKD